MEAYVQECVHGDIFNAPGLLLPVVKLQMKFTKSKSDLNVMGTKADTGAVFNFLDAPLHVKHVKPSPTIQVIQAKALQTVNIRYRTRVTLKTFTIEAG